MKITQQTPTILKLEILNRSSGSVKGLIISLFFFLLPALANYLSGSRTDILNCNRTEPTQIDCEITSVRWLEQYTQPIQNLQSAELQVNTDENGQTYSSLLLNTPKQTITFTNIWKKITRPN